jgi:serine/threonine-protein kinase
MASSPNSGGAGGPAIDAVAPTVPTPSSPASEPSGQVSDSTGEEPEFLPQPDAVLAGKFKLQRILGKGGMGTVWVADHLALKSPVAIKLIDAKIAKDQLATSRFMREAQSAANLRGRNVVQILDYGVDGQTPYIVMEYLEGDSLAIRLKNEKRLDAEQTVSVISDICRAVGRAHEAGIVHRDLKPDNIFLVEDGESELAKVLDFGIAKAPSDLQDTSDGASTQTGALLGTPYYMSPEQAKNSKKADPRSDLWAVGVIAYECLVGRRPFYSDQITDLVLKICTEPIPVPSTAADVPAGFDAWFAKACERDVEKRFQTARELNDALKATIGAETTSVNLLNPPESKSSTGMWIGGAVVLGVGIGAFAVFGGEDPPPVDDTPVVAAPAEKAEKKAEEPAKPEVKEDPLPPAPPPESTEVTIELTGVPKTAEVLRDGKVIGTAADPLVLPKGDDEIEFEIRATGYRTKKFTVKPNRSKDKEVTLAKRGGRPKKKPPTEGRNGDDGPIPPMDG